MSEFRPQAMLTTDEFEIYTPEDEPEFVYINGGRAWPGWAMTVEQATTLRDWLTSALPQEGKP
jgi:hypothetical protein